MVHNARALLKGDFPFVLVAAFAMAVGESTSRVTLPFYMQQMERSDAGVVGQLFAQAELLKAGYYEEAQAGLLWKPSRQLAFISLLTVLLRCGRAQLVRPIEKHIGVQFIGAALGVLILGYATTTVGLRSTSVTVFACASLLRMLVVACEELGYHLTLTHSATSVVMRAYRSVQVLLFVVLGAFTESQWVVVNALVQDALRGLPAAAKTTGNATYRFITSFASVLMPVLATQAMRGLDLRGSTYTPMMLGIVIVGFVGAAGLMCLQQQPLSVKNDIAKRPTEGLVKGLVATYSPLLANTTLMWLCAVVNFQTALDTVINAYAPQKFMDERGFSRQGYGAVISATSVGALVMIGGLVAPLCTRLGVPAFAYCMLAVETAGAAGLALPASWQPSAAALAACMVLHRAAGASLATPNSIWTASVAFGAGGAGGGGEKGARVAQRDAAVDLGAVYALQKVISAVQKVTMLSLANPLVGGARGVGAVYAVCVLCYPALGLALARIPFDAAYDTHAVHKKKT